ncbi:hypothetical protein HDU79_004567 [Rhizoclosmatium sp. JEL0117]|nr:hypothetical protein HDU79_004567 [Rhizoclosmatium sp. JEL0117]
MSSPLSLPFVFAVPNWVLLLIVAIGNPAMHYALLSNPNLTLTSKWSFPVYLEFIAVSDNEPVRIYTSKRPDRTSKTNLWKPKVVSHKDRTLSYYVTEFIRLSIVLTALTFANAYLDNHPFSNTHTLTLLMPWETRAVLEHLAFFTQLYCTIDLCYTIGTLALCTLLHAPYTPVMDSPYLSTSLRDFWSNRWNQAIKITIHRIAFAPVLSVLETWDSRKEAREWRNAGATMAAFGMSAVLHEYAVFALSPGQWIPGEQSLFFVTHGVACVVVEWVKRRTGWRVGGVVGWIGTVLFFLVTGPLFAGPFMRGDIFSEIVPVPGGLKEFFKTFV